uniref:Uncharacterized protein n=1 Tax=Tetraselmis sp. GSL018 TaxID=582737 RepID=A0A061QIK8_9CHLO
MRSQAGGSRWLTARMLPKLGTGREELPGGEGGELPRGCAIPPGAAREGEAGREPAGSRDAGAGAAMTSLTAERPPSSEGRIEGCIGQDYD